MEENPWRGLGSCQPRTPHGADPTPPGALFSFLVCSADGLLLFIRMNPREPAATARRPLRIRVLAKRAAEQLLSRHDREAPVRDARVDAVDQHVVAQAPHNQ